MHRENEREKGGGGSHTQNNESVHCGNYYKVLHSVKYTLFPHVVLSLHFHVCIYNLLTNQTTSPCTCMAMRSD